MEPSVHIFELDPDAENSYSIDRSGKRRIRGVTLAHLLERIGGEYHGTFNDPLSGVPVSIDLSPWHGRDSDSTYLQLRFVIKDEELESFGQRFGRSDFVEQYREAQARS